MINAVKYILCVCLFALVFGCKSNADSDGKMFHDSLEIEGMGLSEFCAENQANEFLISAENSFGEFYYYESGVFEGANYVRISYKGMNGKYETYPAKAFSVRDQVRLIEMLKQFIPDSTNFMQLDGVNWGFEYCDRVLNKSFYLKFASKFDDTKNRNKLLDGIAIVLFGAKTGVATADSMTMNYANYAIGGKD